MDKPKCCFCDDTLLDNLSFEWQEYTDEFARTVSMDKVFMIICHLCITRMKLKYYTWLNEDLREKYGLCDPAKKMYEQWKKTHE